MADLLACSRCGVGARKDCKVVMKNTSFGTLKSIICPGCLVRQEIKQPHPDWQYALQFWFEGSAQHLSGDPGFCGACPQYVKCVTLESAEHEQT
jgi:hypothetical protein